MGRRHILVDYTTGQGCENMVVPETHMAQPLGGALPCPGCGGGGGAGGPQDSAVKVSRQIETLAGPYGEMWDSCGPEGVPSWSHRLREPEV